MTAAVPFLVPGREREGLQDKLTGFVCSYHPLADECRRINSAVLLPLSGVVSVAQRTSNAVSSATRVFRLITAAQILANDRHANPEHRTSDAALLLAPVPRVSEGKPFDYSYRRYCCDIYN